MLRSAIPSFTETSRLEYTFARATRAAPLTGPRPGWHDRGVPRLRANGVDIEYEIFGEPDADPLLLVMGLGAQMILWEEEFCEQLAARGHRVIRFDNRDVGLSSKLDAAGVPNALAGMAARARGEPFEAPYTLRDMATDAAELLDGLGLEAAHVAGASMGGMIAQTLALEHPARVRSLTSIMSTTGDPSLPPPTPEAMSVLLTPAPTDREANIERAVETASILAGSGFPIDVQRVRRRAARIYDRSFHPPGLARQLAAIVASGSRAEALASLRVPTLVIHGDADPLVPVECGIATHAAIPGSELLLIEGMGHDLPPATWPRIVDAIRKHTSRVAAGSAVARSKGVGQR
ncbi:MAG: alpha/beta hydrolase [Deltaproteobacteria bacterium]|nr:MAG: alpha/beta hydrolase [Deltaproteobacteria bacterium]